MTPKTVKESVRETLGEATITTSPNGKAIFKTTRKSNKYCEIEITLPETYSGYAQVSYLTTTGNAFLNVYTVRISRLFDSALALPVKIVSDLRISGGTIITGQTVTSPIAYYSSPHVFAGTGGGYIEQLISESLFNSNMEMEFISISNEQINKFSHLTLNNFYLKLSGYTE